MHDQIPAPAGPHLTRRELRRREDEAAQGAEKAQDPVQEQLPPPGPPEPAPASTAPRMTPPIQIPQGESVDPAAETPYGWESGSSPAYVPPRVRHPSPFLRFLKATRRTVLEILDSVWGLTKTIVLTGVILVVLWNGLAYLAPGFTDQLGRKLASVGIAIPFTNLFPANWLPAAPGAGTPPPGLESSDRPLGVPAPVAANSTSYAFMGKGTDQPFVSYDPCRPIHYVIRPDHAPAGGEQAIHDAVAAVSRATGFVFVSDGYTREAPADDRPAHQPDRYGDRWAPVLIAWETQIEQPQFAGSWAPGSGTTLGLAGSASMSAADETLAYTTGQVRLNAAALDGISRKADGYARIKSVIQHELAHVVGLDHVSDPTQLMTATTSGEITKFAAGDLTGLAMLGTGKCRPGL